jgi:ribonuclease P protein component
MPLGRVRDQRTFRALRRSGARGRSGPVAVTAVLEDTLAQRDARVAFAVGRQVGPAVVRNRVRRRLRAAARELDLGPGAYLVAAGPEAVELSYPELQRHFAEALRKARKATS